MDRGGYYSNPDRKYLTYGNPLQFGSEAATVEEEKRALRVALSVAHALNRTLILPDFHCFGCRYEVCRNPSESRRHYRCGVPVPGWGRSSGPEVG